MKSTDLKSYRILLFLPYFVLFVVAAFYLYRFVNYLFFYQEKSSLFLTTFPYLTEHLTQPGGFLKYLGELQTTFYYYPAVGAILISAEIGFVIFLLTKIGKEITGKVVFVVPFVIGAALLYLQTHYQYSSFNNLGILLQLALFYGSVKYFSEKRGWFPVFFFPLWYFLTGSFSVLFVVLFTVYSIHGKEKMFWLKPMVMIATGVLFFYLGEKFLFFQTLETLLVYPFSLQQIGMQKPLFITVVVVISVLPLLFKINPPKTKRFSGNSAFFKLSPFLVILILVFLAPSRIDKKNSHYFYVEKLFYQQRYDQIIAFNTQFPSNNILTNYLNNIALAEKGILNDMLFRFPQNPDGSTLFLKWELETEVLKRGGYFYYTIGMMNAAQRWAYEYMVMRGNTPEGLKMLVKTELINENYKVAAKYIGILKNTFFYREKARQFEKFLFDKNAVEKDAELGQKKRMKTKHDFFVLAENPPANLEMIASADSANLMAVEYRFAALLLQKEYGKITEQLPLLESAGFERIPKNIEEAVVAYCLLNGVKYPALKKLAVNPQTEQQFQQYYQIFQQNSASREQAQRALQSFAGTYWYYVFFK